MPNNLSIENLKPGDMAIFSWWCHEHQCWTLALPKPKNGPDLVYCPATNHEFGEEDLPTVRREGHFIELRRLDKLQHPWKKPVGLDAQDGDFLVTATIITRPLTDIEWEFVLRLMIDESTL